MKFFSLISILLFTALNMSSQTKIYRGNSTNYNDCLYTIQGHKIYRGNSTNYNDCLFTLDKNKVYQGNSTNYNDCIATLDGPVKYNLLSAILGPY